MSKLILTRGIPGSGKTHWARAWVTEGLWRARVNRDDIRASVFGVQHGCDERAVTAIQNQTLSALMSRGFDIVLDNTNLNARHLIPVFNIATRYGYAVEVKDFIVGFYTAVQQDMCRERPVGIDVIRSFYDRYMPTGDLPALDIPAGVAA